MAKTKIGNHKLHRNACLFSLKWSYEYYNLCVYLVTYVNLQRFIIIRALEMLHENSTVATACCRNQICTSNKLRLRFSCIFVQIIICFFMFVIQFCLLPQKSIAICSVDCFNIILHSYQVILFSFCLFCLALCRSVVYGHNFQCSVILNVFCC